MKYEFVELDPFVVEVAKEDRAAAMAFFLMDQGVDVCGEWRGRMRAADQRVLFGRVFGKGLIVIDGARERVRMLIKICFGQDWDCAAYADWNELVVEPDLKLAA